jgi:hypothetical protein
MGALRSMKPGNKVLPQATEGLNMLMAGLVSSNLCICVQCMLISERGCHPLLQCFVNHEHTSGTYGKQVRYALLAGCKRVGG